MNVDKDEEEEPESVQLPMTTLRVDSKDPLELTITKTSLGLLQNLGQVKLNEGYFHLCIRISEIF